MADVVINVGAVSAITAGTGLTGGTVTGTGTIAADFGTSAGTICQGNDARLTAPVAPLAHASTHTAGGSDPLTLSQSQITSLSTDLAAKVAGTRQVIAGTGMGGGGALSADVTLNVSYGTSGTTACVGNDARLSNARTPSTHASTHATGGTDVLTLGQAQITNLTTDLAAKVATTTTITAGTGLTGGGDLSTNRSLAVAYGTTSTTATVGNDGRFSFLAAGTGASTRTLQNKLRDVVSVKDFGAVGDGVTDDRAAIQLAVDAAISGSGMLYFPGGVYAMSASTSGTQIVSTLTQNLSITGESATIKCTSGTHVLNMMVLDCGTSFSVVMDGIEWDGNNSVLNIVRFNQITAQGVGSISLNNCSFRRSYGVVAGVLGNFANFACTISGGFKRISITNSEFTNHNRALGVPGGGTQACVINDSGGFYPEVTNVTGCLFSNITNSDTAANSFNQDTDGLVVFGGLTTGTTAIPSSSTITNNTFVNCKGRSIKVQADESIVSNNVIKFSILPITGDAGGFIGMQGSSCIVKNNIFHYNVTSGGLNPFSTLGTAGATGSTAIGHSYDPLNNRPKNAVITGNVVFNNVPKATGIMNSIVTLFETSTPNLNMPGFCLVKDNQMCGGATKTFLVAGLRTNATSPLYLTVSDNAATELTSSLMESGSANFASNFISCTNNINHNSTVVGHIVNASSPATILDTNCNAFGNVNIGLAASKERTFAQAFVPRFGTVTSLEENSGQFSIQSVTLADNAEYTFPRRTYFGTSGLRFISVTNFGGECNTLFSQASGTLTSVYTNATGSVLAATGVAGTSAGKLNIGQEAITYNINVRNKLGGTYIVTLFSWG